MSNLSPYIENTITRAKSGKYSEIISTQELVSIIYEQHREIEKLKATELISSLEDLEAVLIKTKEFLERHASS